MEVGVSNMLNELKQYLYLELPANLLYFVMVLVFIFLSKFFRDLSTVGIDDDKELTGKNNLAFGLYTAGFYLSLLLGLIGLFIGEEMFLWNEFIWFWLYGFTILVCTGFSYVITQFLYLPKVKIMDEILRNNNAVAIFVMGRFIFSGTVLMASVHGDGNWFTSLWFYLLGEMCCWLGFRFYLWVTPYNDIEAVQKNHVSVSVVCNGFLSAMGVLVLNSLWSGFVSYKQSLINLVWFFCAVGLLLLFRWLGPRILFPKSSLKTEIYQDNNLGASFITAFFYIALSIIISFSF